MLASSSQDDKLAEMEIVSWGMNAIKEAVKNFLADFSAKEVPPPSPLYPLSVKLFCQKKP